MCKAVRDGVCTTRCKNPYDQNDKRPTPPFRRRTLNPDRAGGEARVPPAQAARYDLGFFSQAPAGTVRGRSIAGFGQLGWQDQAEQTWNILAHLEQVEAGGGSPRAGLGRGLTPPAAPGRTARDEDGRFVNRPYERTLRLLANVSCVRAGGCRGGGMASARALSGLLLGRFMNRPCLRLRVPPPPQNTTKSFWAWVTLRR